MLGQRMAVMVFAQWLTTTDGQFKEIIDRSGSQHHGPIAVFLMHLSLKDMPSGRNAPKIRVGRTLAIAPGSPSWETKDFLLVGDILGILHHTSGGPDVASVLSKKW